MEGGERLLHGVQFWSKGHDHTRTLELDHIVGAVVSVLDARRPRALDLGCQFDPKVHLLQEKEGERGGLEEEKGRERNKKSNREKPLCLPILHLLRLFLVLLSLVLFIFFFFF